VDETAAPAAAPAVLAHHVGGRSLPLLKFLAQRLLDEVLQRDAQGDLRFFAEPRHRLVDRRLHQVPARRR